MALQLGATRNAFLAANVPSDLADKAAEELAAYENRLASVDTRLSVLSWLAGANITLTLFVLAGLFALWSKLGDIGAQVAPPPRRSPAMTETTKNAGQVLSIALTELVGGYQEKLVEAINDHRHTRGERDGLRMAAAVFRSELARLGITNVQPRDADKPV